MKQTNQYYVCKKKCMFTIQYGTGQQQQQHTKRIKTKRELREILLTTVLSRCKTYIPSLLTEQREVINS